MIDFEFIKRRIGKFNRSSLIDENIKILTEIQVSGKENFPFWRLLVLIKWAFLFCENSQFRVKATRKDIFNILELVEHFENKVIDFKQGIMRGIRIIAYQQFWSQESIHNDDFARQIVLFQLKPNFDIDSKFKELVGLTTSEFLKYSYFTFLHLNVDMDGISKYEGVLNDNYWEALRLNFPHDKSVAFTNTLALKGPDQVKSLQKMNDEAYQLYETNFWHLKPFFYFKGKVRILHRSIFNQTVKHFIYDFMKHHHPEEFTTEFGNRMEKYVELGLLESKLSYRSEINLKKEYPLLTKTADFMVDDILIECKAIELHPRAGILRKSEILVKEFKSSIIKSYQQLLLTANAINPKKVWYGLVITYKDTLVGFGTDAWEDFLKEPISNFIQANSVDISILPPENLCFIPLEDWDHIVQVAKEGRSSIKNILIRALSDNLSENPSEKILLFHQALWKHFPINQFNLSFLNKAQEQLKFVQ